MKHYLLNHQPQKGLQAACALQGQAPTCNARGKGHTSASPKTLTKVILVLLTMFLLPNAAWGQGTEQQATYTFTGTTLDGTPEPPQNSTGTATSNITDGGSYNWDIKNFSRTYGQNISYTGGSVTPTTTTLGFTVSSSENITTSFHLVSSAGMTGTFVSATINYTLSNVTAAQVQVLKEDNNSYVPLSYGNENYGYTALDLSKTSATLEMSNMQAYAGNKILDNNKICFSFSFDSNDNNASITINSITITTTETIYLTVAGIPVTSANANNITGDNITLASGGKISFEPAKVVTDQSGGSYTPATLTLNGATINGMIWTSLEKLSIKLQGANKINVTSTGDNNSGANGIVTTSAVTEKTLTITKETGATLEISSTASAIRGFNALVHNGLYIETKVPYTSNETYVLLETAMDSIGVKWLKLSETETYPLWIAGTQVTESNKGNVLGDSKVSFSPADNTTTPATPATLTLDNAILGTNIKSTIKDLKVYLLGGNNITTENNAFIYEGGENDATLTFSTVDPSDYENLGMLTINGISSKSNIASNYAIKGLVGETSTAIDNWGLDRSSTLDTSVSGWKYQENNTQGKSFVKLLYREVYDLWIASSEHRYYSENLGNNVGDAFDPKTSTLTLTSVHDSYYNRIYSGLPALTIKINNSDNELKSISFGAPNGETISATSGTLTIKKDEKSTSTVHELALANADTDGGVISGFSSVTIEEPMGVKSPSPFTTWEGTHNAIISDEVLYDLWVMGQQVTSANASDIFGAAQSSQTVPAIFDAEESTLTLNGLQLSNSTTYPTCIESGLESLTVTLSGDNIFRKGGDVTTLYGFKAQDGKTCNITFEASGSFSFMVQTEPEYAVSGFNKVTYKDNLVAYMDDGFFNIIKLEPELSFDTENDNNSKPVAISIKTVPEVTLVSHKIAYAIDYADENIADVPETEYTDVIPLATITAGPCTVSAYTLTLDGENTKSNNTDGYYFAYKESELTIGIGATVDLKDYLLPALPEGGVLINRAAESQELISIKEGDYTITGNANGATVVKSFAEGNFTVFNQRLESEDFELKMNVTVKDVISDNTFSRGQSYGTFFNTTEAYNVPKGLTAYIITNVNEEKGTIEMTGTSVLPPNTPVLLYRTSTTVSPNYVFTKASNVEPVTTKLKYTTTDKPAEESSKLYVLYNGQFVKVTSGTKILANHCYLDLANTSAGTRGFYDIDGSDGTTAIKDVKSGEVDGEKWADGGWHDLQGRRLSAKPTKPGLYILNGKKVVIK